jgi:2,4-dienoyl-CoA reductase-like NADH-dependent reductase (Old Yellow Enzyme family)
MKVLKKENVVLRVETETEAEELKLQGYEDITEEYTKAAEKAKKAPNK